MHVGVVRAALRASRFRYAVLALLFSTVAHAGSGLDWLTAQQDVDGSYGGSAASLATRPQATAEVLRAQLALNQSLALGFEPGLAWLNAHPEVNTEFLARKVTVNALAGRMATVFATRLLTHQNADGGFGHRPGFDSSVTDTALAVEALGAANYGSMPQVGRAVSFLLARQQGNGGWAEGANDASVSLSAVTLRALWPYRSTWQGVAAALTRAQGFLASRVEADGLWGEDFVSAQVLLALVPAATDLSGLTASATALQARQLPDDSWAHDTYTTALVLQALRAYEARSSGGTPAPTGSVSGYVVRANSTEPIAGATVSVAESPDVAVLTNSEGYFVIPGLPAGGYTLTASRAGFTSASVAVGIQANQVTLAGRLVLDVAAQTGLVRGKVVDSTTSQALASVQVSLEGTAQRSVLTNGAGDFDFGALAPGAYAIRFQKTGYRTLSGTVTVTAGETVNAQLAMTPDTTPVDDSAGLVSGRVVDGKTGQPLAGAAVSLGSGLSATTAADGTFAITDVPRGSYQGTVRATGYQGVNFSLMFGPGSIGDMGALTLYPEASTPSPTSLTLRGTVSDGVNGAPVGAATVQLVETGASATTTADGRFVLTGITLKDFSLAVSAAGYAPATYTMKVGAFGEAVVELKLSPPGSSATTSNFAGLVTDADTGAPVAGALVSIDGTNLSAITGADGGYTLAGIESLEFTVKVSAVGYGAQAHGVKLAAHGSYTFSPVLVPVAGESFQIVALDATQPEAGADGTVMFTARIASLLDAQKAALVLGEIQDATGTGIAVVRPYLEGTTTPGTEFSFAPDEVKTLTVPWNTAQFSPGVYRLVLRVVEPGTVSRALPTGEVLAEDSASARVKPTQAVSGAMSINPPLTQAGLPTPVSFSVMLRNAGNVPLAAGAYVLTVVHPDSGETLFTAQANAAALEVGELTTVFLGTFTPMQAGNLQVRVRPVAAGVAGEMTDRLYVGDKATGSFTVSRTVVPEGNQTVRGKVAMQGVDTSQGGSTDPLFAFVKESVRRGGVYTAPEAENWHRVNRCLGCHIQTQSLLGLSSSFDKAPVDRGAATFLYNSISSSQWSDGALRISHPEFQRTQTTLGLWSLSAWPDIAGTFRTKLNAAKYLQARRYSSGDQTWWSPDYATGWWNTDVSHTALTVKGFANVLKDATRPEVADVKDYSLATVGAVGTMSGSEDLTAAPDGTLYVLRNGGAIDRLDPATAQSTRVVSGLPAPTYGLDVAADGTFFVTRPSNPTVIIVRPDGTRQDVNAGGYLIDGALGPDGWFYATDYYSHRVLRVSRSGQVETFVSGGLIYYPYSVVFDADGNLLVSNMWGYNIAKVAPNRTVTTFADGLAYPPMRMTRAQDGSLYVLVAQNYSEGMLRVRPDGSAERLFEVSYLRAVAAVGNQVFATYAGDNTLKQVRSAALDTSSLAALRAELPRAVRYLLASYQDNNSDNTVHALRLMGLAEARPYVDDATLRSRIDTAITYEADLLRQRQRADGGWGRYVGYSSDPLVSAMVGIALEYTDPSPADPQIRKAIQYLLATQRADGSWDNNNNGLSTRLASTSFVMVFMPKALERLGGIDVDLRLDLPGNVTLSNPTLAPTTVQPGPSGVTAYTWRLLGVTGSGREVEFDLGLANMVLDEQRPVSTRAFLEFDNSFLEEKVQVPLDVPVVRAASGMTLAVKTDALTYPASAPVAIQSTVTNTGPTPATGQVVLAIHAVGSTEPLVELPPLPVDTLSAGASRVLPAGWNTGSTLAGDYEVRGRLLDALGRVVARGVAPLRISSPSAVATTAVVTDKAVYGAWDAVRITGRVGNAAPNALLAPSKAELTVRTPGGATLFTATRDVRQLMPGALLDLPFPLTLSDAAGGSYPVTLVLRDALSRAVLSTATTTFQVERRVLAGVSGSVSVAQSKVYVGDANACTDTARSASGEAVPGVVLVRQLVDVAAGTVLSEVHETVDLAANAPNVRTRSISTQGLAPGGYACVLQAELPGETRTLGFASFQVETPPIRFSAKLSQGGRGRLLILLDAPVEGSGNDNDPYGPTGAPGLIAQKAFLKQLLDTAGWSYDIVEWQKTFAVQMRTGGYGAFMLLSEFFTLDPLIQKELREAVFRGEGLVVAGDYDSRHKTVHDALGLRYVSKVNGAARVVLDAPGFPLLSGEMAVLAGEKPLQIERRGAQSLGTFRLASGYPTPTTPLDAVTLNAYGHGESGFAGMDLLAIATRDGQTSKAADVLRALLERVHPVPVPTGARAVVPVQLDVENQGMAAPITATVVMPPGVELVDPGSGQVVDGQLTFTFPLDAAGTKQVRFWVRLPKAPGPVDFTAVVKGGLTGAVSVDATLRLSVTAADTLTSIQAKLLALSKTGHPNATALKSAASYVGQAAADEVEWPVLACESAVKASDALLGITDPSVVELRAALGVWLRQATQDLPPPF
ncbi:carboxypeptidase regulatory-like domain-containing protein [Pyxidicoccus parkwayensis]|uniref:Carboxypeptidase regulatory-like domain-containing protein n=1 Tax=Pyxidicoccus parkwayensis TaxID=2813578 RepID=A0ABX7NJA3_9BACT|nr:carboxypeptidase regulatory-like domain-containing protein [Pyxidicoccus parkwaysis]QSQ18942.1 carboxypeptidase regulatory-like domain-containing protein [Pyxidicoccus parkwaysis]